MIQEQAREVLRTLRAEIAQSGYENARSKGRLQVVFSDVRFAIEMKPIPDLAKRDEICKLEKSWQQDRCDLTKDCGAATIETILCKLEGHISVLPTEVKPNFGYVTVPTESERAADSVISELKKRGLQLASA